MSPFLVSPFKEPRQGVDPKVRCQFCGQGESRVVDSRPVYDGTQIRRRRECMACKARFSTHEILETVPLQVIKRDGRREEFSRQKLLTGLLRASEKRPIAVATLESLMDSITMELANRLEREVPFQVIGDRVLAHLRGLDKIAYVRFASVYKSFQEPEDFLKELESLLTDPVPQPVDSNRNRP